MNEKNSNMKPSMTVSVSFFESAGVCVLSPLVVVVVVALRHWLSSASLLLFFPSCVFFCRQ